MTFTHDAIDPNVLLEEFKAQANGIEDGEKDDKDKNVKPKRAKFFLFMIPSWSIQDFLLEMEYLPFFY